MTLWGPTHMLMVGGASLATLGVWVLLVEGVASAEAGAQPPIRRADLWFRLRTVSIAGGFLIGLSTLQGEFDYGVPQFQLVYQPILIAFAAGDRPGDGAGQARPRRRARRGRLLPGRLRPAVADHRPDLRA